METMERSEIFLRKIGAERSFKNMETMERSKNF